MVEKKEGGMLFLYQGSKRKDKWGIEKYALQMIKSFERMDIHCKKKPIITGGNTIQMFINNFIKEPFINGWGLFFCKEKNIYLHYDFFVFYIFWLPFLAIARVFFGKRIIVQFHEYRGNLPYKRLIKIIDLMYCLVANNIIIHNFEQLRVLTKQGFKKLYFLDMPIDNTPIRTSSAGNKGFKNILMHGAIIRKKGYETGIKAINLLPSEYFLTLVGGIGDVTYFNELIDIIKVNNLEKRVKIIPNFLSDIEYEEYIYNSDLIIYPYTISTASAALAEGALKFEKPFLTSNLESFINYIGTDKYSFIIGNYKDLSNKIININYNEAIEKSKELKKTHNRDCVGEKLLNHLAN